MSKRFNAIDQSDYSGADKLTVSTRVSAPADLSPLALNAPLIAAPAIAQAPLHSNAASMQAAGGGAFGLFSAAAGSSAPVSAAAQQIGHDAMATGLAAMKSGDLSVLDGRLLANYYAASGAKQDMSAFVSANQDYASAVHDVGGTKYITVDLYAKAGSTGADLLQDLHAHGVDLLYGSSFKNVASGMMDASKIGNLVGLSALNSAHESSVGSDAGRVNTQADRAEEAGHARVDYGVDGSGVKVGVLSDSFDTGGVNKIGRPDTMETNIETGDLTQNTTILTIDGQQQDYVQGTDEGRGMAQLVHDLAPGAAIEFATAYGGQAGFANNIIGLAHDGAQIIVDDVFYYAEPQFQDGIIAQAVDQVVREDGVTYFSSAGNQGVNGWEGEFNTDAGDKTIGTDATSLEAVREQFMEFAPGQDYLELNLQYYDTITLSWDQPSVAAGNPGGATGDLDFYLTNEDGSIIYRASEGKNLGDVPFEMLDVTPADGQPVLHGGPIYLRVGYYTGDKPEHIKIIDFNNDLQTTEYMQNDGTTFGHSAAAEAISVAAASWHDTPEYGTDPAQAEYFSSKGPVDIWLTADGTHLDAPEVRHHPQITAVDGGNTTFFGSDDLYDRDINPNFYGTSAAAPDAAAVGALMLDMNSALTKEDVLNLLQASASDMDDDSTPGFDAGYDARTGAGLINAQLAVGFAKGETIANRDQYILDGTHLDDKIAGSGKANELNGGDGDDKLVGRGGADSLLGGQGLDRMFGGSGSDQLASRGDGDFLSGGSGDDVYIFTGLNQSSVATIADLSNKDTIDFSTLDADANTDGRQSLAHVDAFSATGKAEFLLAYNPNSDRTTIKFDLDGDGHADHNITVLGGDVHTFDNFIL